MMQIYAVSIASGNQTWRAGKNTIWLFNIAMENPLSMEVYSWENHLFPWVIFHGYVK